MGEAEEVRRELSLVAAAMATAAAVVTAVMATAEVVAPVMVAVALAAQVATHKAGAAGTQPPTVAKEEVEWAT